MTATASRTYVRTITARDTYDAPNGHTPNGAVHVPSQYALDNVDLPEGTVRSVIVEVDHPGETIVHLTVPSNLVTIEQEVGEDTMGDADLIDRAPGRWRIRLAGRDVLTSARPGTGIAVDPIRGTTTIPILAAYVSARGTA
jgi:hypothetical protein